VGDTVGDGDGEAVAVGDGETDGEAVAVGDGVGVGDTDGDGDGDGDGVPFRMGASAVNLAASGVRQSAWTWPPVIPLFGLNDQYAKLMALVPRYETIFAIHCLSDVVCSAVPNSPSKTGAMPCFWM
jgi:hypothetical protein